MKAYNWVSKCTHLLYSLLIRIYGSLFLHFQHALKMPCSNKDARWTLIFKHTVHTPGNQVVPVVKLAYFRIRNGMTCLHRW